MNPLYVGIYVRKKNNVAYLMKPDDSKHNSFSVQNNHGGAKLLSARILSALGSMRLSDVVIVLEAFGVITHTYFRHENTHCAFSCFS